MQTSSWSARPPDLAGRPARVGDHQAVDALVRPRDDMLRDELADPLCCLTARLDGRLHGTNLAAHDDGHEPVADQLARDDS